MVTTVAETANTYVRRLLGAAVLDVGTYEEVEADKGATGQALATVVLSSLAAGIGSHDLGGGTPASIAFIGIVALMAWAAWSILTYHIGVNLLPERQTKADVGELLRTIGFASAPGILRIGGVLPGLTIPLFALTSVWMLFAMIVAVRQALDYTSTSRAVFVCAVGWVLVMTLAVVLGILFETPVASAMLG